MTALTPGVADIGGARVAWLECGTGPVVLCLHGFPDHAPTFAPLLREIAGAGSRAISPFMRGYAPSQVEHATFESAALARDVIALADHASPDAPVDVVGHDWGGVAAQHAAVLEPSRFRSLVTIAIPHARALAAALRRDPEQLRRSWYEFVFLAEGFAERVVADDGFAFVRRLIAEWSPGPVFGPEEWDALARTLSSPGVLEAALGYYRAAFGAQRRDPAFADDARRWADPVPVRTLAIHGERDGCIAPGVSDAQDANFTGRYARLVVPDVGHWPHREAPQAVTAAILDWIG
ncbi:MAG: alpha/beta hydrolase [Actinobacteria bacterium]|nr:alpha/beta hydrolase [Actinomycetota bacterium]